HEASARPVAEAAPRERPGRPPREELARRALEQRLLRTVEVDAQDAVHARGPRADDRARTFDLAEQVETDAVGPGGAQHRGEAGLRLPTEPVGVAEPAGLLGAARPPVEARPLLEAVVRRGAVRGGPAEPHQVDALDEQRFGADRLLRR